MPHGQGKGSYKPKKGHPGRTKGGKLIKGKGK